MPHLPFGGEVHLVDRGAGAADVPERLVVVGAGYIGLELGTAFRKLGAEVTVVEAHDRILPQYDDALDQPVLHRRCKALGIDVHLLGASAGDLADDGRACTSSEGGGRALPADQVLVTVGRRARHRRAGA